MSAVKCTPVASRWITGANRPPPFARWPSGRWAFSLSEPWPLKK